MKLYCEVKNFSYVSKNQYKGKKKNLILNQKLRERS